MTGHEIQHLRIALQLSQQELAQLLGVHWVTVSKWEREVAPPDPYRLALLLQFQQSAAKKAYDRQVKDKLVQAGAVAALALLLVAALSDED